METTVICSNSNLGTDVSCDVVLDLFGRPALCTRVRLVSDQTVPRIGRKVKPTRILTILLISHRLSVFYTSEISISCKEFDICFSPIGRCGPLLSSVITTVQIK